MKCFLDMDGVLVEFKQSALRHHGLPDLYQQPEIHGTWDFIPHTGMSEKDFWKPLGSRFWSSLPWEDDGKEILDLVERYFGEENVCILSSPCDTSGCIEGKRKWIKKNMPKYLNRMLIGKTKDFCAGPSKVLVDDADKNVNKFSAAGGIGLLVPRITNSKHALRNETVKHLDEQLSFLFNKKI